MWCLICSIRKSINPYSWTLRCSASCAPVENNQFFVFFHNLEKIIKKIIGEKNYVWQGANSRECSTATHRLNITRKGRQTTNFMMLCWTSTFRFLQRQKKYNLRKTQILGTWYLVGTRNQHGVFQLITIKA